MATRSFSMKNKILLAAIVVALVFTITACGGGGGSSPTTGGGGTFKITITGLSAGAEYTVALGKTISSGGISGISYGGIKDVTANASGSVTVSLTSGELTVASLDAKTFWNFDCYISYGTWGTGYFITEHRSTKTYKITNASYTLSADADFED